ncbi:MAG: hypothetical protein E7618_00650 [Ruminococcaceae bacterium]|nr:hypothetical protein [Oscillospiraceae bacterium]
MKQLSLRLTVMLLLVAMLATIFAACQTETPGNTPKTDPVTTDGVEDNTSESIAETDPIPDISHLDGLNYKDETVRIMHRGGGTFDTEFEAEASSDDIVDQAVYKRNRQVEEKLGVVLEYIPNTETGWQSTYLQKIRASVLNGDGAYDIFSGPAYHITTLIVENCYFNLNKTEYIDFSHPWWANGVSDGMAIDGKVYLCTGDISLGLVKYLHCLIFNENLLEDIYNDTYDLYQIVQDGQWTLEKMAEVTMGTWSDVDKNNDVSDGDRFGYVVPNSNLLRAYIDAVNLNILHVDENGNAALWVENQTHVTEAIETLHEYFNSQDVLYIGAAQGDQYALNASYAAFKESRALFVLGRLTDISSTYRDISSFEYGVLPLPKYDEDDDYGVTLCGSESTFGISSALSMDKINRASAVLEALCYYSYQEVTPVYYEEALQIKYDLSEDKAIMLDYIRQSATFNPNCQLNILINNGDISVAQNSTDYAVTYAIIYDSSWMNAYDSHKDAWQFGLNNLVDKIKNQE